jgi:hypothetical protein
MRDPPAAGRVGPPPSLDGVGTGFSDVTGVAISEPTAWIVGSAYDSAGGISATGNMVWEVGCFNAATSR